MNTHFQDREEAVVIKPCGLLSICQHLVGALRTTFNKGSKDFDRDRLLLLSVLRTVDLAHFALPQGLDEAIAVSQELVDKSGQGGSLLSDKSERCSLLRGKKTARS